MKRLRIVLGVLLVLVLAYVGVAWESGRRVQALLTEMVQQANQNSQKSLPPGFSAEMALEDYQRGVFSSHVRYVIRLKTDGSTPLFPTLSGLPQKKAGGSPSSYEIALDSTISHGPFPMQALARGLFAPRAAFEHAELVRSDMLKPIFDAAQGAAPLSSDTSISYSGNATVTVKVSPMRYEYDGARLTFDGATLQGDYTFQTLATRGHVSIGTLDLASKNKNDSFHIAVEGTTIDLDVLRGKFVAITGQVHTAIKRVSIESLPGTTKMIFNDLAVDQDARETGDTVSGAVSYRIGKVTTDGRDWGGGQFTIKTDKINGNTIKPFNDLWLSFLKNPQAFINSVRGARFAEVAKLVIEGISTQPELSVGASWKNDKGDFQFDAGIAMAPPAGDVPDPNQRMLFRNWLLQSVQTIKVTSASSVDVKINDKEDLSYKGAKLDFLFDRKTAAAKFALGVDQLSAHMVPPNSDSSDDEDDDDTDDGGKNGAKPMFISIQGANGDLDFHLGQFGVPVGHGGSAVKHLEIDRGKGQTVTLDDLGRTATLSEDAGAVDIEDEYHVGKVTVYGQDFGGGQVSAAVNKLDGASIGQVIDAGHRLALSILYRNENRSDSGKAFDEALNTLVTSARGIITAQSTAAVRGSWKNDQGAANVTLDAALTPTDAFVLMDQPLKAIKSAQGRASVSTALLRSLVERGMAVESGLSADKSASASGGGADATKPDPGRRKNSMRPAPGGADDATKPDQAAAAGFVVDAFVEQALQSKMAHKEGDDLVSNLQFIGNKLLADGTPVFPGIDALSNPPPEEAKEPRTRKEK